jgi:hypothetical protein
LRGLEGNEGVRFLGLKIVRRDKKEGQLKNGTEALVGTKDLTKNNWTCAELENELSSLEKRRGNGEKWR